MKTEPPEAQVLLDGTIVKPGGSGTFQSEHIDAAIAHTIMARRAGFHEASETVTLRTGESKVISLTLQPELAVLRVDTDPTAAEIYVDDRLDSNWHRHLGYCR